MTTLVWQRTTYSGGHQEHPAVYVRWDDVTAYLGRPHDGDPDQDERLVQGLLESGAPDWVQDAPGWIDEHGWGLYRLGMKEEKTVLKGIMRVAQEVTDFDNGFDRLFGFMAANPESRTTKDFTNYHIIEMNSPALENGDPDFTYLIGKDFVVEHWVNEDDMEAFKAYVKKNECINEAE